MQLGRDERGSAVTWVAILTPLFLLFTAFATDLAMIDLAKARIQAAVDAAALAGASAGEVQQEWDTVPVLDDQGQPVLDPLGNPVMEKVLVREWIEIPPGEGRARARAAWAENAQYFPGGRWTLASWDGHVQNLDTYVVDVRVAVKTFLAGPLMAGMSGDRSFMELTIHRTGSSRARKK